MGAGQSGGVEFGGSLMGYQVLRVYPDSPGSKAGLRAYFDFIIAIGDTRFNKEDGSLREILKASVDQKIKMTVYNTRTKVVREVDIVPTTSWGGSGLLGVSIKHSSFDKADERVWHVIEVAPGSPAQQAGFKAMNDYVIGSDSILQENDDLYNLIEAHEGKALKLFVYNVETDNCREIICHPNSKWGGNGLLGCEFGHGLLHRMPFNDTTSKGSGDSNQSSVNYQKPPVPGAQVNNGSAAPQQSQPSLLQQQADILTRTSTQPGQQLFQQALFNNQAPPPQQHQQAAPKPVDQPTLPPPPQAPQTFAQLASAQFQAQQYQQQTEQIKQQLQQLEQQRQQIEEQQRQMEQLSLNQPEVEPKPVDSPPSAPNNSSSSYLNNDQPPQAPSNYQQGPPTAPSAQQQQQPPPNQYSPPPQAPPPTQPVYPPPPTSPPRQAPGQQQQQNQAPPQFYNQYAPPNQMPQQHQQQQQLPGPFSQYPPYGVNMQSQMSDQRPAGSPYGDSSESSQTSLPPSLRTRPPPPPPPPAMYPPPPQAPPTQQPQQQQQQESNSPPLAQPPSRTPPPPPPPMFPNQM